MDQKLFSVSPMSQHFSLEAGYTYSGTILISNSANAVEDFAYTASVAPYSVLSDGYSTDFSTMTSYTAITDWITIENPTGTLSPNQHNAINFTITVPENAPAGGQYAAIVFSEDTSATAEKGGVKVNNVLSLASVIYADVTGITVRGGQILSNEIPSFSFDTNISVSSTIENTGNVHGDAITILEVTNLITGEKIFPAEEAKGKFQDIIMPESTRYLTRNIDNLPPLGAVKISQTVYFNDLVSENEQTLILCPIWFIFLVIFAIISIITALVTHHRHRKKRRIVF